MIAIRLSLRHAALLVSTLVWAGFAVAQSVPAPLRLPAGAELIGTYPAKGVQIYVCAAQGTANAWIFKAPEAELTAPDGKVFARHYAGPTWEADDGSKIVGTVLQSIPAPSAGAIPWLLLSAQVSGQGVLAKARFVQRIKTAGGISPSGACPTPSAEQRVPYTAEYVFYK